MADDTIPSMSDYWNKSTIIEADRKAYHSFSWLTDGLESIVPTVECPTIDGTTADLMLELLPLCLRVNGHATSEDYIDFSHLFIAVGINLAVVTPTGLLGHRCCWWWHLFTVQKSFALFQIMSSGTMDLIPLLCIVRATEMSLFFVIRGLLLLIPMISAVFAIFAISPTSCVDFSIVLLLL
jgi:hypothetical protein